jgi:tellurite methyltransferase
MKKRKYKYQDEYEQVKGCFWEKKPAKFVRLLGETLRNDFSRCSVLDLGAGEGKNAVYLANLGAHVIAVDVSEIALSKFHFQPGYETSKDRLTIVKSDIIELIFEDATFDVVVAYGILHALLSKREIFLMLDRIKSWTKKSGFFVAATFTKKIQPPSVQDYLEYDSFLDVGELQNYFSSWRILFSEDDIITESHPTTNKEHQHSITRIIAQKP